MLALQDDLELRFLETGIETAKKWHENNQPEGDWNVYDVITPEALMRAHILRSSGDENMLYLDALVQSEPGLVDALIATVLTEDGITYYPMGVGRTFNPAGNRPDDNDPHNLFARRWSSQEYQHAAAEMRVIELLGLDLSAIEEIRKVFVNGADIPMVESSFDGVAYTAPQESLTVHPYQKIIETFKTFYDLGLDKNSEAGQILGLVIETYRHIAYDERQHRKFITDQAYAGLHSGDPRVAGAMMLAIAKRFIPSNFPMPGSKMPNYRKRAISMARARLFTGADIQRVKKNLLTKWRVGGVDKIDPEGYEAQLQLGKLMLDGAS